MMTTDHTLTLKVNSDMAGTVGVMPYSKLEQNISSQGLSSSESWEKLREYAKKYTVMFDVNCITDVKVINEKVVLVKFNDNKEYKQVCKEEYDTFSLERALYLAVAKHNDSNKELTSEGIEHAADELKYQKKYVKIVKDGLKLYENKLKEELEEKERAELIERKRVKRHQKKTERASRKREEQINIQKEAYIRAMKEYNDAK